MSQQVILVNDQDEAIGTMEKMEAHQKGLLHRAFSVFIFNSKGEILLQQRAQDKYHSAGLWTNTCCSHPQPGENIIESAQKRLGEEMGFTTSLTKVFDFTYRASFENGLIEHEFDHVFTGKYDGEVNYNPIEVMNFSYRSLDEIRRSLQTEPENYTAWFRLAYPRIERWMIER